MQFDPSHSADIINYYYTNYSQCPKDGSFFATWQFVSLFTHSILIVQLPLTLFTAYCILKKTPKAMGSLKWAMLNVHFWSSSMDVLLCSLVTPYIFFPTLSGFSIGLLNYLGVSVPIQTMIGIASFVFMVNSMAALFENRSSSFEMNRFRFERTNAAAFTASMLPIFVNIPNQDAAKFNSVLLTLLSEDRVSNRRVLLLPHLHPHHHSHPGLLSMIITVLSVQWLWMTSTIIFFISCITYYIYFVTRHQASSSLVQLAIPSMFWAIPGVLLVLSYLNAYYNQSYNNIGLAFVSLHGVASQLAIMRPTDSLCAHYGKNKWCCCRGKVQLLYHHKNKRLIRKDRRHSNCY